jgi:CubicO group peptidase (beta-lactamase class C family)
MRERRVHDYRNLPEPGIISFNASVVAKACAGPSYSRAEVQMFARITRERWVALLILAAAVPLPAHAQSADLQRRYEDILHSAYPADQPGAAALVVRGSKVEYLDAAGMANLELGVPLEPNMVFEIGSITKQFTAAAIMMLAEEGKLSVDDPITRHLPDYPDYGNGITIENLLTHTSGIFSYTAIDGYMQTEVRKDVSVAELIAVVKDLPVEFAPGERWKYSNSGYILLGAIIESASGMSYADFMRTRIFEPLNLQHTSYGSRSRIVPNRAAGYGFFRGEWINAPYLSMTQPYSAGALMSTVEDLHRWTRALFGGKVVGAKSLNRMTTPYVLNDGDTTTYAYGLSIREVRGHRAIGHGGGIFGYLTDELWVPEGDLFVAVFSNSAGSGVGPTFVARKLAAAALGDPYPEWEEIAVGDDVLARYVGVYEIEPGVRRVVTLEDGALYTQRTGGPRSRAYPSSETHFFYRGSLSHFEFVLEGDEVTAMLIYPDGAETPERADKISGGMPDY